MSNLLKRIGFFVLFLVGIMFLDYRMSHEVDYWLGWLLIAPITIWVTILSEKLWPSSRKDA